MLITALRHYYLSSIIYYLNNLYLRVVDLRLAVRPEVIASAHEVSGQFPVVLVLEVPVAQRTGSSSGASKYHGGHAPIAAITVFFAGGGRGGEGGGGGGGGEGGVRPSSPAADHH